MKKFLTSLVMLAACGIIQAQAPQSFKYQAVVRNAEGLPLVDQAVSLRITLLQGSAEGFPVYQETHAVTSNSNGVVDVRIGEGTVTSDSSFASIDWSAGNFYLKTEIDINAGTSFSLMGTSPLLSVPYARYAERSTNIIQPKSVNETDPILFQVRDRAGNPVFVVYEDGVEVLLPEKAGKGGRGGFVVGGRSAQKGPSADIFRVNSDSARFYLNPQSGKGGRGGFVVGGRSVAGKGDEEEFINITPQNYFIGLGAGKNNKTGFFNSFLGYQSGYTNEAGSYNTFLGYLSGYSNTKGNGNVFIGSQTGYANTEGLNNLMIGMASGVQNIDGSANIFLGSGTGYNNINGSSNVFVGENTGALNVSGSMNIFVGQGSGYYNKWGNNNVFLGTYAGVNDTIGNGNVFLGGWSGYNITGGDKNVFLGFRAGFMETNVSDRLYIDNIGLDSNEALVYGEFDNHMFRTNGNMGINTQGKNGNGLRIELPADQTATDALWIHGSGMAFEGSWQTSSDARLKRNIQSLQVDQDRIMQLHPVNFEWKNPRAAVQGLQVGFLAQEVESVFPELVQTDAGGYKSIDYSKFSVLLVSFVQEQNRIIQSQETKLLHQQEQLDKLQQEIEHLRLLESKVSELEKLSSGK